MSPPFLLVRCSGCLHFYYQASLLQCPIPGSKDDQRKNKQPLCPIQKWGNLQKVKVIGALNLIKVHFCSLSSGDNLAISLLQLQGVQCIGTYLQYCYGVFKHSRSGYQLFPIIFAFIIRVAVTHMCWQSVGHIKSCLVPGCNPPLSTLRSSIDQLIILQKVDSCHLL